MTRRYCPRCGARLTPTTSRGGLPRRVCPECSPRERDGRESARTAGSAVRDATPETRPDGGRVPGGVGARNGEDGLDVATALENIREHPSLAPEEKDTTIGFVKSDDRAHVYTDQAGIARRLLVHREARVEFLNTLVDNQARRTDPGDYTGETVVGVKVTVPVPTLLIKQKSRGAGGHAEVVSDGTLKRWRGDASAGGGP